MVMEHGRLGLSVLRRTVVLSGWMAQKLKRMGAVNLVENQYVVSVSRSAAVETAGWAVSRQRVFTGAPLLSANRPRPEGLHRERRTMPVVYHKDRMQRATILKQRALEIGFDLAGLAPLSAWEDLGFSRRWVEQGYGGEMRYLENPKRDDPRRVLPSVKSVVCVGLVYNAPLPYSTEISRPWSVVSGQLPQTVGAKARTPAPESKIS